MDAATDPAAPAPPASRPWRIIPARHARWLLPVAVIALPALLAALVAASMDELAYRLAVLGVLLAAAFVDAAAVVLAILAVVPSPSTTDARRDRLTTGAGYALLAAVLLAVLALLLALAGGDADPTGPAPGRAAPGRTTAAPSPSAQLGPDQIAQAYLIAVLNHRSVDEASRYLCDDDPALRTKTRDMVHSITSFEHRGGQVSYSWTITVVRRSDTTATVTSDMSTTLVQEGRMIDQPVQTWTLTMAHHAAGWRVCGLRVPE